MSTEKSPVLKGHVSKDNSLIDKFNSLPDFDFEGIIKGVNIVRDINEQINILNINPDEYNTQIYDDIISYNNDKTFKNTQKTKKDEIKQNNKRLSEQKKFAQKQLAEYKKQRSLLNKSQSNLTKLNALHNNKINFNKKNQNTEPLIKKKQKQIVETDTKNREISERRSETLYGSENTAPSTNTFYLRAEKNNSDLSDFQNENTNNINYVPDISNAEKTLFPQRTLSEMPLMKEPLEDVKKNLELEKDNIIKDLKEKEINIDGIEKIKLKEIVPDIEKYIPPIRTKDEKRADIIYKDMKKSDDLKKYKDKELIEAFFRNAKKRLINEIKSWKDEWGKLDSYKKNEIIKYLTERINSFINMFTIRDFTESIEKNELAQMIEDYLDSSEEMHNLAAFILKNAANILEITEEDEILKTEYTQFADIYNSADELPDKYKSIIKEKLKTQNLNENSSGLYFYPNSTISQSIVESTELKNKIKKYMKNLSLNSEENIKETDTEDSSFSFSQRDLYYALNNVDIRNLVFSKDGTIKGDIIDTTDFNEGKNEPNIVNAARVLQEKGRLKPKFLIIHFVIPKEKVDEIRQEINNEINK